MRLQIDLVGKTLSVRLSILILYKAIVDRCLTLDLWNREILKTRLKESNRNRKFTCCASLLMRLKPRTLKPRILKPRVSASRMKTSVKTGLASPWSELKVVSL